MHYHSLRQWSDNHCFRFSATKDNAFQSYKTDKSKCRQKNTTFQCRPSLSKVDEFLLFAECMIFPSSLHDRVIKEFHYGHQGINHVEDLDCSYVYLPNIDKWLKELAHKCSYYQLAPKLPEKLHWVLWLSLNHHSHAFTLFSLDQTMESVILYLLMHTANGRTFFKWVASL